MINLADDAMTIKLDYELPEYPKFEDGYRRAPRRESHLTEADKALAIKNALRYIHPDHHEQMAKEFAQELEEHGRISVSYTHLILSSCVRLLSAFWSRCARRCSACRSF